MLQAKPALANVLGLVCCALGWIDSYYLQWDVSTIIGTHPPTLPVAHGIAQSVSLVRSN
jgi:hypothetical protein